MSIKHIINIFLNPDYVIGFLRPDNVRGEACPVFTGSVAIARNSVVFGDFSIAPLW
ncbi:hypothetical protein [Cyclobacterium amurskyense]|uniref:Uncharacterized protein n=1 Tax=Cyclobacterium amurskyense TaxID=320787 RepID=A0A0H4Q0L0_9BACT|nr:hypothetical protein [Cyclobacterium amurskyense]AKP54167.1 hypothetical protein CA2015_4845 [Cyclobacterium amurskyense]